MKIGIELRQIVHGECGGIVPLLHGVLQRLFSDFPQHEFVVFCTPSNSGLLHHSARHVQQLELSCDRFFAVLDREAYERKLDVLFRSYPMDAPLDFPASRQIVLIPDLQHEFFPQFFSNEILAMRRGSHDWALRNAGAIATISEHARHTMRQHRATRCQDIFLMSPSVPVTKQSVSESDLNLDERDLIPQGDFLLYPANFWPHKNHRRTIQAFRHFLVRGQKPFQLILTGHATDWQSVANEFPHVPMRHLGFVRRELLQCLLQRAKAIVFFSLYEGFGMPLLEAFSAGTPVVCSNTTSLPEIGGDAIVSCDPTDFHAMGEAMLQIVSDDELRKRLVYRGRARLDHYSWRQSAENLVAACERIERSSRSPKPDSPRTIAQRISARLRKHTAAHVANLRRAASRPRALAYQLRQRFDRAMTPLLGVHYQHAPIALRIPARYARSRLTRTPPVISIVTPSYNQVAFLERTIKSVLDQEYPRLEYVIQDGGSSDGSREILRQYHERLTHCESAPDSGQANAINLGFRHTTGDIMAYLNSDDILLPHALKFVANYFVRHPDVDAIYGHRIVVNEHDQEVGRWILPPHDGDVMKWEDYIPQETLFWRRRLWDRVGGAIDEDYQFAMDWDLLLRFQSAGARFARVPRFLAGFRVHPRQKTHSQMASIGTKEIERLRWRSHCREVTPQEITSATRTYLRKHALHERLFRLGLLRY
jgi:glycosyltransferase involved in cell wall biosynthesis